jgi:hypothetical protein
MVSIRATATSNGRAVILAMGAVGWLIMPGVALVASAWHPFGGDSRSAARSAGLRLAMACAFFFGSLVVPQIFDRGNLDNTDTCPDFINAGSTAWWVAGSIVCIVGWSCIGVFKASGVSVMRREGHAVAVVLASAASLVLTLACIVVLLLSGVCP